MVTFTYVMVYIGGANGIVIVLMTSKKIYKNIGDWLALLTSIYYMSLIIRKPVFSSPEPRARR